ncbi:hypothetical protein [Aquiflexum sp.]|uniref:hypothetical protein n=1 Tax=Aquiflexum sp. TaxID=1872584 RepID=UPI0035938EA4
MLDIDPASLGISLIALLAFIWPLYYYSRKQKLKLKSQQEFLDKIRQASQLHFDHEDHWRGLYGMGLDIKNKKLIYVFHGTPSETKIIDLQKAHKISFQKTEHEISNGKEKRQILDHLAIQIDCVDKSHVLEFYNCDRFSDLDGEWPLAKKWENILKPLVKENKIEIYRLDTLKGSAVSLIS